MRALVVLLALSGCAARPKPPPRPLVFVRYDADGRRESVWTEVDCVGGWIQRSHGWEDK